MGNPLLARGRLNRRATIVRPTTTTNTHNEPVESGTTRTTTWCSLAPGPGTERFQNAELAATAPMRFVFAWRSDLVRDGDRIEADDGRTYEVVWWAEIGVREGLEVLGIARSETTEA
jgi:head-tail adaptor